MPGTSLPQGRIGGDTRAGYESALNASDDREYDESMHQIMGIHTEVEKPPRWRGGRAYNGTPPGSRQQ